MSRAALKQPKGLYPLIFTEMWERFGFYMIQAILILYLSQSLGINDTQAFLLYGVFGSMCFLTPVLGGYIADRWIGFKRAILLGGIFLIFGYVLMALRQDLFFLGMSLVIIGIGFFKPNITGLLGDLYAPDDPRQEGGFTLFYMGINVGVLIPPLIAGSIVTHFGWSSGFRLAALGIVIALVIFSLGNRLYANFGKVPAISPLHHGTGKKFIAILSLGIVFCVALLHLLFMFPGAADIVIAFASIAILITILFFVGRETHLQRRKFFACLILILMAMGFWAIYNQIYSSLMLFASRNMSIQFLGVEIRPEFTQFFNPFFILLLSPFFGRMWVRLGVKKLNPSIPYKFSFGLLFVGAGMFALSIGVQAFFSPDGLTSPWWLVLCNFLITVGELLISPIGLAMIARLAPPHYCGLMMGVWFLSTAGAFAIGGGLATLAKIPPAFSRFDAIPIYSHAFMIYGAIAFALALVGFVISPYLKRLIGETNR